MGPPGALGRSASRPTAERPRAAPAAAGHGRRRGAGRGGPRLLAAGRPGQPVVLRVHPRPGRAVGRGRVRLRSAAPRPDPGPAWDGAAGTCGRWSRRSSSGCCWQGSSWSAPSWCGPSPSWTASRTRSSTSIDYADQGSTPLLVVRHGGQRDRRGAVLPRCGLRRDHRAPGALDDRGVRRRDRRHRQRDADLRGPAARRWSSASSAARAAGSSAPILTHCTWSLTMLFALPLVFS